MTWGLLLVLLLSNKAFHFLLKSGSYLMVSKGLVNNQINTAGKTIAHIIMKYPTVMVVQNGYSKVTERAGIKLRFYENNNLCSEVILGYSTLSK